MMQARPPTPEQTPQRTLPPGRRMLHCRAISLSRGLRHLSVRRQQRFVRRRELNGRKRAGGVHFLRRPDRRRWVCGITAEFGGETRLEVMVCEGGRRGEEGG